MNLAEFRAEIDEVDVQIVNLLARRVAICKGVAEWKLRNSVPVMQPARVAEVRERRARLAAELGLNPGFVDRLYQEIIAEMCRLEEQWVDNRQVDSDGAVQGNDEQMGGAM